MLDGFHQESNELKHASLYANFDGYFTAPRDAISGEHLGETRQRSTEFIAMTHAKISILTRWTGDVDSAANKVAQMWTAPVLDA